MNSIDISELTVEEGGKKIIDSLTFSIAKNSLFAIVGASGSGKTTLIKCINALRPYHGGKIIYNGQDIMSVAPTTLRSEVVLVEQEPVFFEGTVQENLLFPFQFRVHAQKVISYANIEEVITMCALSKKILSEDALHLSGGEKQRLALARALLLHPKILLLDEPTSALDIETEEKIKSLLLTLKEQMTIIMVTHSYNLIAHSNHVMFLCAGKLVKVVDRVSYEDLKTFLGGECNIRRNN